MIIKKFSVVMQAILIASMLMSTVNKSEASVPTLPYTVFIVPVTLATLCAASFGWSWWIGEKVERVDKKVRLIGQELELVAAGVQQVRTKLDTVDGNVQAVRATQGEHTQQLNAVRKEQKESRESADHNFAALGTDIGELKKLIEKETKERAEGQAKIMTNVDGVRGSVERRLDEQVNQMHEQAKELAAVKAMLSELHAQFMPELPRNHSQQASSAVTVASTTSTQAAKPFMYSSVFRTPVKAK